MLLLAWAIYRQVFAQQQAGTILEHLQKRWHWPNNWWLLIALALVPTNISLETIKFHTLTSVFLPSQWWRLFKSVLGGISVALITPNRVGEYAGRVLFLEGKYGWKAVVATLVGSWSQLLVLIASGILGTLFFHSKWLDDNGISAHLLLPMGAALVALLLIGFYNLDMAGTLLQRLPFGKSYHRLMRHLSFLRQYSNAQLTIVLALSALRYLTYCIQYYLLLRFYGLQPGWLEGIAGIAMVFLVQASVPLPPLMGLMARGEIAILIFRGSETDSSGILAATLSLFFINVAFPAVIGMWFIIRTNLRQTIGRGT